MSTRQTMRGADSRRQAAPEEGRVSLQPQDILRGTGIAFIVLAFGLVLGNFTFNEVNGRGTGYFVLAAGLGIVLAAVTYQKLELALLAYLTVAWAAVGATPDVATGAVAGEGKGVTLSLIGVAFLLTFWVLRGVTGRGFSFVRSPLNGLLALYVAFNVLCAVNGRLFWDPKVAHYYGAFLNGGRTPLLVVVFEVMIRLFSVATFWLFANNLENTAWLRRASWLLMAPGLMALLCYLGHLPLAISSYMGVTEVVLACTVFAWLLEPRPAGVPERRGLRPLGWLLLALIVYQLFYLALHWVSGYLGLFMGLYFVAFLHSKRFFAKMLVFGVFFYVAVHTLINDVFHKVTTSSDMDRFKMAHGALLYALHFPLGIGPGNYRAYNIFYGSSSQWATAPYTSDHNFYAQMLSETGFVGLAIILAAVITALALLSRFYRNMAPGWSRTFLLGITGMWAGICTSTYLGDYLIPVYYNGAISSFGATIYAWIGLGIGFAHARHAGLLSTKKAPAAVPAAPPPAAGLPSAAEYYPRRMTRDQP